MAFPWRRCIKKSMAKKGFFDQKRLKKGKKRSRDPYKKIVFPLGGILLKRGLQGVCYKIGDNLGAKFQRINEGSLGQAGGGRRNEDGVASKSEEAVDWGSPRQISSRENCYSCLLFNYPGCTNSSTIMEKDDRGGMCCLKSNISFDMKLADEQFHEPHPLEQLEQKHTMVEETTYGVAHLKPISASSCGTKKGRNTDQLEPEPIMVKKSINKEDQRYSKEGCSFADSWLLKIATESLKDKENTTQFEYFLYDKLAFDMMHFSSITVPLLDRIGLGFLILSRNEIDDRPVGTRQLSNQSDPLMIGKDLICQKRNDEMCTLNNMGDNLPNAKNLRVTGQKVLA